MTVAKPNYQFQKRQKELARKQKKDEKRQRKRDKAEADTPTDAGEEASETEASPS